MGGRGVQRPVIHVNQPKKMTARSALARSAAKAGQFTKFTIIKYFGPIKMSFVNEVILLILLIAHSWTQARHFCYQVASPSPPPPPPFTRPLMSPFYGCAVQRRGRCLCVAVPACLLPRPHGVCVPPPPTQDTDELQPAAGHQGGGPTALGTHLSHSTYS